MIIGAPERAPRERERRREEAPGEEGRKAAAGSHNSKSNSNNGHSNNDSNSNSYRYSNSDTGVCKISARHLFRSIMSASPPCPRSSKLKSKRRTRCT